MVSRWLALALSFSIAFAPVAGQAMPARLFCPFVLTGPSVDVKKHEVELKKEIEEKTLQLNLELQGHWDVRQAEIMNNTFITQRIYEVLTSFFVRKNKHTYSFTELKSGIPQKILLWVKNGPRAEADTETQIQGWLESYRDYPRDRRILIERMAATQTEEQMLKAAKDLKKYPVDLEIPQAMENGAIQFESRHYVSEKMIDRDLLILQDSDRREVSTFWARHFRNRKSLEVRDREQAALRRHLEIVQAELEKLKSGLQDSVARDHYLQELAEILNSDELTPPPYAVFLETRRTLLEEVYLYNGFKKTYDQEGVAVNNRLRENNEFTLGVDQGDVGIFRKGLRLLFVTIPLQIPTVFMAWALPASTHAYDIYVQPSSYMKTIIEQPDATYLQKSRDFLKDRYGVDIDRNNNLVLSKKGAKAIERLAQEHATYKKISAEHAAEDASLNELLSHPHKIFDVKVFTSILLASNADAKKLMTENNVSPIEQANIEKFRVEYRVTLKDPKASKDPQILISELYGNFLLEPTP